MVLIGDFMAISNVYTNAITVYDLVTSAKVRTFGGLGSAKGQFHYPGNLCGLPDGSLLVAEGVNKRLQQVTLEGEHVRFIGEGAFDSFIIGLATNGVLIAVGKVDWGMGGRKCLDNRIMLFSVVTGLLVGQFGECGENEGQVVNGERIRFMPDGHHIIVTENAFPHRGLSIFTVNGVFVKSIGNGTLNYPTGIDFTTNGEVVACDIENRIVVLPMTTGALQRKWGTRGLADGQFNYPKALQVHRGLLYVMDENSLRVQVFH